ncbi:kinesin-related protein 4-like [Aphidius gifuensis]|uniref:kinesin-related protein 4-like n=1 Tax=Aphidius gifuensis TaxID=684658 RepID=UPI001CDBF485|nr:kinesin-related protein 4-like [Aphidius gifuensis]
METTTNNQVKNIKLKDKELFTDSFNICWELLKNANYYLSNRENNNSFSDLSCTHGQIMYKAMMTVMDNIIKYDVDIALPKTEPNDGDIDDDSFHDCNNPRFDTNLHQQEVYQVTSHTDEITSNKNGIEDDAIYPNKRFKSNEMDPLFITCDGPGAIKDEIFDENNEEMHNDTVETNSAQLLSSALIDNSTSIVNDDEFIQSFDTDLLQDETIDTENSVILEEQLDVEKPKKRRRRRLKNTTESTRISRRIIALKKRLSNVKKSSKTNPIKKKIIKKNKVKNKIKKLKNKTKDNKKDDQKNCLDHVDDKDDKDNEKDDQKNCLDHVDDKDNKDNKKEDEKNCLDHVDDKDNKNVKELKNIENVTPEIKITNDIPFEEKRQIVLMAQENPSWSLTKLSKHFGLKHMIQKSVLKRWEKQLTRGGTRRDMIGLLNQWVYEKCLDYQSQNKKLTNQQIKDWGSEAKEVLKLDSLKFIASDAWRFAFKEKYKITGNYIDLKIEPNPQKIDTLLRVYVSYEMKVKIVKLYDEHPDWDLETLKKESGCDHILNLKQLRDWKCIIRNNNLS